jgi:hypothetical protein
MEAIVFPDEKTTEDVGARATALPGPSAKRVRVVLFVLLLLALLVSLLLWGLLR